CILRRTRSCNNTNKRRSGRPTIMTPFIDAEEAWFWFMASEKARADGAKTKRGYDNPERPCTPIDIYAVVTRLRQMGILHVGHMITLKTFGVRMMRPDPTVHGRNGGGERRDERQAAKWWDEAMGLIEIELRKK